MALKPQKGSQQNLFGIELPDNPPVPPVEAIKPMLHDGTGRLFPDHARLVGTPKLRRLMDARMRGQGVFFYELEDQRYLARELPEHSGDSIAQMGIFEWAGEHGAADGAQIAGGGLSRMSDIDRGFFSYHGGAEGLDMRRAAILEIHLTDECLKTHAGKGFATRLTELLLEKAGEKGVSAVFAKIEFEDDTRRLHEHRQASEHILRKLGFDNYATTDRAKLMRKTIM